LIAEVDVNSTTLRSWRPRGHLGSLIMVLQYNYNYDRIYTYSGMYNKNVIIVRFKKKHI
jgi:hypothetical protein